MSDDLFETNQTHTLVDTYRSRNLTQAANRILALANQKPNKKHKNRHKGKLPKRTNLR